MVSRRFIRGKYVLMDFVTCMGEIVKLIAPAGDSPPNGSNGNMTNFLYHLIGLDQVYGVSGNTLSYHHSFFYKPLQL